MYNPHFFEGDHFQNLSPTGFPNEISYVFLIFKTISRCCKIQVLNSDVFLKNLDRESLRNFQVSCVFGHPTRQNNSNQRTTLSISSLVGTITFINIQAKPVPPTIIPELSKNRYKLSLIAIFIIPVIRKDEAK